MYCFCWSSHVVIFKKSNIKNTDSKRSSSHLLLFLVAKSCTTFCNPGECNRQAPPSMGFPRQEYWSGLPFPSPRDLPDPGIEPRSPALQADALPSDPPGKPIPILYSSLLKKLLFSSKSCLTLCNPMDYSNPGFTVLHCLLEFVQPHAC